MKRGGGGVKERQGEEKGTEREREREREKERERERGEREREREENRNPDCQREKHDKIHHYSLHDCLTYSVMAGICSGNGSARKLFNSSSVH